ncbi:MAG TPA: HPr family phosphocarrier protein [Ruminococcaceae bacterium]|nr:HPr family phosphocarrier protein [Oscillospiraceae bacterium]
MVTKTVKVVNAQGMHMRPAGELAKEMKKFADCTVTLKCGEKTAKASAVMQIMAAGIKCGSEVEIIAEGENEQAALDKAVEMFESGFGE